MEEYFKSTKHIVDAFKPPLVPMTPRKPNACHLKITKKEETTSVSPIQNHFYDYVFLQTFS